MDHGHGRVVPHRLRWRTYDPSYTNLMRTVKPGWIFTLPIGARTYPSTGTPHPDQWTGRSPAEENLLFLYESAYCLCLRIGGLDLIVACRKCLGVEAQEVTCTLRCDSDSAARRVQDPYTGVGTQGKW